MENISVQVEVTGRFRSGTSAKGNPYTMAEGYVKLPGIPYPQKFSFYCTSPNEVPPVGFYEVPIVAEIRNDRPEFTFDPRQGRRVAAAAAPAKP